VIPRRARAFSLVELAVVLVILAIMAAAVTLRAHGPMRQCRMEDVVDRVVQYDYLTRSQARQHGRAMHLVVDLNEGQLRRTDVKEERAFGTELTMPRDFRVGRLLVRDGDLSAGSVSIAVGEHGWTPSYAVRLDGPGGRKQWLLFLGLTGQALRVDDERTAQDILAAGKTRRDAG